MTEAIGKRRQLRSRRLRALGIGLLASLLIVIVAGCSSTASFDSALAKSMESTLHTKGDVDCDHRLKNLWLCSFESDPGSNSTVEMVVRRGPDDCWTARHGGFVSRPRRASSPGGLSSDRYEAVGPTFRGCA